MRKVKLYGKLAELFGKEWELDVKTVGEALRAIDMNTRGKFSEYFLRGEGKTKKYNVGVKKEDNYVSKEELNLPFGNGDIFIMPVLQGSDEVLQTIVGVILIVVGAYFQQPWLVQIGASLVLGGIAQMLAPNPNINNQAEEEQRQSTLFQGNASTIFQGGSVGIVYGRCLVAPMPISLSLDNEDVATTASTSVGSVQTTPLPGGGYQYNPGVPVRIIG